MNDQDRTPSLLLGIGGLMFFLGMMLGMGAGDRMHEANRCLEDEGWVVVAHEETRACVSLDELGGAR